VNWILDADIEGFFDDIDREWLVKFVEHRIGDRRIVRLVQKWLNAGIIEDTDWSDTGKGTPQGAILSPLLANVYLHYVFDLWLGGSDMRRANVMSYVTRTTLSFVLSMSRTPALCLAALKDRMEKFGLRLHPAKTRLIEFGRGSAAKREREGRGRCETFDLLGFTHICGKTRRAKRFALQRKTIAKRMRRTLASVKEQLQKRRHDPLGKTGRWLASVVRGWLGYHSIPGNFRCLDQFIREVTKLWLRQIRRRSQRGRSRWTWSRMDRLSKKHLPRARIQHPYPGIRFHARLGAGAV